jgi:hypothetical protein
MGSRLRAFLYQSRGPITNASAIGREKVNVGVVLPSQLGLGGTPADWLGMADVYFSPCFARSGKQTSLHFWGAPLCSILASAPLVCYTRTGVTPLLPRLARLTRRRRPSARRVGISFIAADTQFNVCALRQQYVNSALGAAAEQCRVGQRLA